MRLSLASFVAGSMLLVLPVASVPTSTNQRSVHDSLIQRTDGSLNPTSTLTTTDHISMPILPRDDDDWEDWEDEDDDEAPACTMTSVPDENGHIPYGDCGAIWSYYPSFTAAVVFAGLFTALTLAHLFEAIWYKKPWCWVIIMGSTWEVAAFAFRAVSAKRQLDANIYMGFQIFVLLAPIWVNAFCYMTLGRMIWYFIPSKRLWKIHASVIGTSFVVLDVVAFFVQLVGGSMAGPTATPEETQRAIHIYMGGIGVQQFFLLVFVGLAITFQIEAARVESRPVGSDSDSESDAEVVAVRKAVGWRPLVWTLYFALAMITVRIIYRLVEYSSGNFDNPLTMIEGYFYGLEAVPMFLALLSFTIVHPGMVLVGPRANGMPGFWATIRRKDKKKAAKGQLKVEEVDLRERLV